MSVFDSETLKGHLRSRDTIEWLETQMKGEQDHPLQDLYERRLIMAKMVAAEAYHALAWFFDAYPQVVSVKPVWVPFIEPSENTLLVRFRLKIKTSKLIDEADRLDRETSASSKVDPLEHMYGYDDAPPSIKNGDQSAFDDLVELCEGVGPEIWNEFSPYALARPDREPYISSAQVEADMSEDLSEFLAQLKHWLFDRKMGAPSQRRPSSRM